MKRKEKIIGALAVVAVVLLVFVFTQKEEQSEQTIKLGFSAPLTGAFPDWGEAVKRGTMLAVEDADHDFDVDYQDSVCGVKNIVGIGKKFFEIDGIKIVIGPGCLAGLKALMPLAIENDAILFSTGLLDQDVLETYDSNVINFATQISMEASFLSSYWEQEGVKSVALIHAADDFGVEFGNQIEKNLNILGIELLSKEGMAAENRDLRTTVVKLGLLNPDVIMLNIGEREMGIFARQAREIGYEGEIHAIYTAESESLLEAAGGGAEGLKYSFPVNSADGTLKKERFVERYKEKFGEDAFPNANTYFVYDGIMLLDEALGTCEPTDTECVEAYFKNLGSYSGLAGDVVFQKNGASIRPFGIKQITDGQFEWIEKDLELHSDLR